MTTFYLICFALGLSLTVLAALGAFAHLQAGHVHVHFGHGLNHGMGRGMGEGAAHVPGHAGQPARASVSPVNGFTLAAFLCWFGGCGYLLARSGSFAVLTVLALATVTGLAGGAILFWFLVKVLLPHERELTAEETAMVGVLGRISAPVGEAGTGEIQFTQNGSRCFAAARSEGGTSLARGTEVVVMRYEQGIAYVRPWDEVSGELTAVPAPGSETNSNSQL